MPMLIDQVRTAIVSRSSLVYLVSAEEGRIMQVLEQLARETGENGVPVHTWSCVDGLPSLGDVADTREPVSALQKVLESDAGGFFVMKDLAPFMGEPRVIRALRECYYAFAGSQDRFVFILSPDLVLPDTLKKQMYLLEILPPGEDEILLEIARVQAEYASTQIAENDYQELAIALKGMTLAETSHVLHRVLSLGKIDRAEMLDEVFTEKEMIVKKSGYLEFSPPRWNIKDIGGLDSLKLWLTTRRNVFNREAVEAGVPIPKGLLVMGVSGCGKSLAVKTISSLWEVPLFRLDMNLIFSGLYGSAEAAFHHALQTLEAVAPAVLWIDEIEGGLGMQEDGISIASHIFSAFLTWMQEKPPLVFVAATANRIHALPAEVIRKGRFDQVFFCDLPTESERGEILRIHLQRNDADLEQFDTDMLAILTDGWNGAEIEQAITSGRIDAYAEGRDFTQRDVTRNAAKIVPLSMTMETQIKTIRSWAFSRATPASKFGKSAKAGI